jgi:hypothetical protein
MSIEFPPFSARRMDWDADSWIEQIIWFIAAQ